MTPLCIMETFCHCDGLWGKYFASKGPMIQNRAWLVLLESPNPVLKIIILHGNSGRYL